MLALVSLPVSAATLPGIGNFEGEAGTGTSNGVVTDSPLGDAYVYVTTAGSDYFGVGLAVGGETNGSELTSFAFMAEVGSVLDLFFNYVTADGAGFADYAYVFLTDTVSMVQTVLFTARTTDGGDTGPGFDLPPINPAVTLNPAATPIIDGGPEWAELGIESGACFTTGCGYTGWINAEYTFAMAGLYTLTFGVVNALDDGFASGLAIAGVTLDGGDVITPNPSPIPLPAAGLMLIAGLGALGAMRKRKAA